MSDYKNEVKEYFKEKADEYDLTDEQLYWVLSDNLLWDILDENVLSKIKGEINFLDAGAGTGRWSIKILNKYPASKGLLVDLSEDMLRQAKRKLSEMKALNRVNILCDDLDNFETHEKRDYNLAISFHNVLGFVKDPMKVISKMASMVTKGGYVVCGVPNYYHNIFFNIYVNNLELAEECLKTHRGRFTTNMPSMNMFTPENLKDIYAKAGIDVIGVYGFPITIYPGMQETQLKGQTDSLSDVLSDKTKFDKIFELEKSIYKNQEAASRGNQLIIIGRVRGE